MARPQRIALVIDPGSGYGRAVIRGVRGFVEHLAQGKGADRWLLELAQPGDLSSRTLDADSLQGALVHTASPEMMADGRAMPAVVGLSDAASQWIGRGVGIDNAAVGRAAAEHLLGLEPVGLGCCGPDASFAASRFEAFEQAVRAADGSATWCGIDQPESELLDWLIDLPKPAAVFACNDLTGLRVMNLCRVAGVAVPDELAILGVDNDELICELARPSLSSIVVPAERVGDEAAAMLHRLLAGRAEAPGATRLPPGPVIRRQSTQPVRTEDPHVRRALRYLREHATERIQIEDVLAVVGCSRRHLEQLMKGAIGRTPGQELTRLRIERAKMLLARNDLTIDEVARRCGYRDGVRLSVAFKREVGLTPGTFRRQQATGNPLLR